MDPEAERRCRERLQSAKLWGEKLASFELDDTGEIARQLVDELGLPFYDEVADWVTRCIGEAKAGATLSARASGLYGSDLRWRDEQHKTDEPATTGPVVPEVSLALPAKGERKRKRRLELGIPEGDRQAMEHQEREGLCIRFRVILERFQAPCLRDFSSDFDQEKIALVVSGRLRNSSLKRYLRFLEEFLFWMHRAKLRDPPFVAGDAIDYLFMLADRPCGPTIPGAFLKSLTWFERVAGFSPESDLFEDGTPFHAGYFSERAEEARNPYPPGPASSRCTDRLPRETCVEQSGGDGDPCRGLLQALEVLGHLEI